MTRHRITLFLLVSLFIFSSATYVENTVLDKRLSLQVNNQPLHVVLHQIERMTGVSFAYMSGLIDKNKLVSISVNQTSLKSVLQKLITNPDVLLYVLDNQLIFYQKDTPPPATNGTSVVLTIQPKTEKKNIIKEKIIDTQHVVIRDTQHIVIKDTLKITVIDTIQYHDTVTVYRTIDSVSNTHTWMIQSYMGYIWQQLAGRSAISPFYISEKNKSIIRIGAALEYYTKNLCIGLGFGIDQRQWQANYNSNIYKTDYSKIISYEETVSWEKQIVDIYTIAGHERTVYDSTKIISKTPVFKTDTIKTNYNEINSANYLFIPLCIGYTFDITKRITLTPSVNIELNLLSTTKGKTLLNTNNGELTALSDGLRQYYITSSINCRTQYWFTNKIAIGVQCGMAFPLQSEFKNTSSDRNKIRVPLFINICYRLK